MAQGLYKLNAIELAQFLALASISFADEQLRRSPSSQPFGCKYKHFLSIIVRFPR